jgi:hypothetical protein
LSAAARPPRATPTARLKAAVGTARRASRQLPRPARATPDSRPRCPDLRPALRAAASRSPPRRPRRRPDRSSLIDAAPLSAVPTPVSRYPSAASRAPALRHRRLTEQRRAGRGRAGPPTLRTWAAHAAPAEAVGRTSAAHAGRAAQYASGLRAVSAQLHPVKFY